MNMTDQEMAAQLAAELAAALPAGFELGVATAAFQIEGATHDGGRGPSGWDQFCAEPGRVLNGDTADVACDHYHRVAEDIALLRELGVDSYRFSIAWPRICPDGSGRINEQGLGFYDSLVDQLLAAGIKPMATLYHWDTPLPLERAGGWLERDTAERFGDYAAVVAASLGDRVDKWVTVNEPATVMLNGYGLGVHAPGNALLFDALPAAHHQLLAHGLAAQALRAAGVAGQIGITNVHSPVVPAGDGFEDGLYAELFDIIQNRIFSDPVLLGHYPDVPGMLAEMFAPLLAAPEADLAVISAPLDFYGLNYYAPTRIAAGAATGADAGAGMSPDGAAEAMAELPFRLADWPEYERTGFGWPIAPHYFGAVLGQMRDRYAGVLPPVYITENGASFQDTRTADGQVHDPARVQYLAGHLQAILDAVKPGGRADGVDLRGYFAWSLMDNFEWAAGYSQRFGLVHVDFGTLERTPKDSYRWLQDVIRRRA